jgi:hypothetical protein
LGQFVARSKTRWTPEAARIAVSVSLMAQPAAVTNTTSRVRWRGPDRL